MLRQTVRWAGPLLASSVLACAVHPPVAAPIEEVTATPAPSEGVIRLFRSDKPIAEKGGRTLPLWLVEARVAWPSAKGAVPTSAIVDTGAQTTLIDRRFAVANGLPVESSNVVAKDFAGNRLDTSVINQVTLEIGPLKTQPLNVIVVELPALFQELGIGIIWSPQTSVPRGSMLRFDFGAGTATMQPESAMPHEATPLCKAGDASMPAAATIVPAAIAGQPVRLELDSGATKLGLSSNASVVRLLQQAPGSSVGERIGAGGAERTLEVPPQELKLAGQTYVASVSVADEHDSTPGPCDADGEIGLEVLQHCTVDLAADRFVLSCRPTQ